MNIKLFTKKLQKAVKKAYDVSDGLYLYSIKSSKAAAEVNRLVKFYEKQIGRPLDLDLSQEQISTIAPFLNSAQDAYLIPTCESIDYGSPMFTGLQDAILWNHYLTSGEDRYKNFLVPYQAVHKPASRPDNNLNDRLLDIDGDLL